MDGRLDGTIKKYAQATGRDLHIDAVMTNMTVGYRPSRLIAPQIYPGVQVPKQSDLYYVWTKAEWLRVPTANRGPGAPTPRVTFTVGSQTYFANGYGLGMELPWEDLDNADDPLELRNSAGNFIMDQLNLAWEDRLSVTLTTTTNMGSSTSLTNRWSDEVNGTPVRDIFTGFESIRAVTGMDPNTFILSAIAFNNLRQHPEVIDFVRGKGTQTGGPVTTADLAAAFGAGVPGFKVLVGGGVKNTAAEGAAGTYTDIWSTAAILLHVAPAPGRMTPSHGYTFQWRPANFPAPFTVIRRPNEEHKTEVVEILHYQAEQVVASDLGYLIVNT